MGTRRYVVRREDFRGPYDPAFSYPTGSIVRYAGSMWRSLRPVSGVAPVEGADWTLMAAKGDRGIQGIAGPIGETGPQGIQGIQGIRGVTPRGAYSGTATYVLDDLVTYNFATWRALTNVSGVAPSTSTSQWELFAARGAQGTQGPTGRGFTPRGAWDSALAYAVDDIATYGGATYRRIVSGTTTTAPDADAVNWERWAAKGETGSPGAGVPTGGSDGQYIRRTADGSTVWETHAGSGGTAHANATTSAAGFQAAADKDAHDRHAAGILPVRGYVSAAATTDQPLVYGTTQKVIFASESADPDNWYEPDFSRYTPKLAGLSFIRFSVLVIGLAGGDEVVTFLYKNGAEMAEVSRGTSSATAQLGGGPAEASMNGTTDYLEVFVLARGAGGANPRVWGVGRTNLSCRYVGRPV